MHAWTGWTAAPQTEIKTTSTWEEWCACQQRLLGSTKREPARQPESSLFSERERARLSFVRWLYQTGRLEPA